MSSENIGNQPLLKISKGSTPFIEDLDCNDRLMIKVLITTFDVQGKEIKLYKGPCNIQLIDPEPNIEYDESGIFDESDIIRTIPSPSSSIEQYVNEACFRQASQNDAVSHDEAYYEIHDGCDTDTYLGPGASQMLSQSLSFDEQNRVLSESHYADVLEDSNSDEIIYNEGDVEYNLFHPDVQNDIIVERKSVQSNPISIQQPDTALKQLMSPKTMSLSKQTKTITFFGESSQNGVTVQTISLHDPTLVCKLGQGVHEMFVEEIPNKNKKKYKCERCKQIFIDMVEFKKHIERRSLNKRDSNYDLDVDDDDVSYYCKVCKKTLKNQRKIDIHLRGHGDPNLECDKCFKVYASKFTLKSHQKLHEDNVSCDHCDRILKNEKEYRSHLIINHSIFSCEKCDYNAETYEALIEHSKNHEKQNNDDINRDNDGNDDQTENEAIDVEDENSNTLSDDFFIHNMDADTVIKKVIANEVFLMGDKQSKAVKVKDCTVCQKKFKRVSDLKRHLIEHVIKSTLTKTPVSHDGTLNILCVVCRAETFSSIDKFKAHLRRHAKLTIYQCIFCDKSFSDSSNFSKHKKTHGESFMQCDLCSRKFNSKKMIARHMEHHMNTKPMACTICNKVFHFKSTLNKHMRAIHHKEIIRFHCRFCNEYFRNLKGKWDHEWSIHNVRKSVIDCSLCGRQYRKYSELKKHCYEAHNVEIPFAKKFLKRNFMSVNFK